MGHPLPKRVCDNWGQTYYPPANGCNARDMAFGAAFWTAAGFTAFLGVIAFVSFMAYWSLRRMDEVVLRARMYMNRKRLFRGFLSVAIGMITLFALVLAGLVGTAFDVTLPSETSLAAFVAAFVFIGFGCYDFYGLSRPPVMKRSPPPEGG